MKQKKKVKYEKEKRKEKTILKYEFYILKISFIVNTDETLIFINFIIRDTVDLIIDKVKTRLNNHNNIQCDICYNEFINCTYPKTRFICLQCNLVYCFNCSKNLVKYGKGITKCPNCRKITDTTLRNSEHFKLFLEMAEKE